jgi:hypothetical protein
VNLGGEPERDDFGLPPVDIEIPDDARELDRDVQAYRREQRALRRHLRRRRLHGPLASDGMVMPLLAGCLVFALIAAVLLTVFAATGDVAPKGAVPRNTPRTTATGTASTAAPATIGPAGTAPPGTVTTRVPGRLPDKTVEVSGARVLLPTLTRSALALVPPGCTCAEALQELIAQAVQSRVPLYLVATAAGVAGLQRVAARHAAAVQVADDRQNVLATTFRVHGLAVILVQGDGSLALAQRLQPGLQLQDALTSLRQDG